jgi:lipopolysaccharide/colanic/teichoic acid biosynthesis glycosyltransferase
MIAVLLILFVLPLMAVVALAIKLDSRGPVFSRTPRTDRGGRQINILRFRTSLSHPAGDRSRDTTRVGWFLWSTRIDGLPQLFNVVRGDMSLLGRDRPCPDL